MGFSQIKVKLIKVRFDALAQNKIVNDYLENLYTDQLIHYTAIRIFLIPPDIIVSIECITFITERSSLGFHNTELRREPLFTRPQQGQRIIERISRQIQRKLPKMI